MKQHVTALIQSAVDQLKSDGVLNSDIQPNIVIERTRDRQHGDLACNIAMVLAKAARCKPRDLAEKIVAALPASDSINRTEIAGPGFINFYLDGQAWHQVVRDVLSRGDQYGRSNLGAGRKVQVEFVSANPTGPLHVGHGRGAAYGASVADLLEAVGFDVHREYYVNDAGRQMDILCTSVWLRYLELCGEDFEFPANGYQGDYVLDIAATLHRENSTAFHSSINDVLSGLPDDEPRGGDKEVYIDAMIAKARELLGEQNYRTVFDLGLNYILDDIRDDLSRFGIEYQAWYSERRLTDSGAVDKAIEALDKAGHLYEDGGALWFRSTRFGDEKDRVVKRDNGQTTYFASDIAYHMEKFERGFSTAIDIWGADHHGYVPRVRAALQALGSQPDDLQVQLVQFAILYRDGEKVPMSTRSGQFVTLRELRKEVGRDAARFFYVMRKSEQHLDFDLDLAKSRSNENPVYYIQYAHARVCSVIRQLKERGFTHDPANGDKHLYRLGEEHEQALMMSMAKYPELVEQAALNSEPHQVAHYLRELANDFHTYYNAHQFLVDDADLRDARLNLIVATQQVIANGLVLLGVSCPETM